MTITKNSPTAEPAVRELVISRIFDAPRALVWKAWTDPRQIEQWWGPYGFTGTSCEMDVRVGGTFHLDLRGPDGMTYPCKGVYREVKEPEHIVYDGEIAEGHPCGAGLPPHSRVTVSFAEKNQQTTLTLHTRFISAAQLEAATQAGYRQGWEDSLQRLTDLLQSN